MIKLLAILAAITAILSAIIAFPEGPAAVLVLLLASGISIAVILRLTQGDPAKRRFFMAVFLAGLILRVAVAVVTHLYALQAFFCVDAIAFDETAAYINAGWQGDYFSTIYLDSVETFSNTSISGWGISYLAASIYYLIGRNPLAVQLLISVIGANTALLVHTCASEMFRNERVARISAFLVMAFPSMVLWSSQLLKDGVVIFFIVASLVLLLKMQRKFEIKYLIGLGLCLAVLSAFRFYIVLALAPAIAATFLIDPEKGTWSVFYRTAGVLLLGLVLSYFGFLSSIERSFGADGYTLERLSANRQYLTTADSGFGRDIDVTTAEGISIALPVGFTYLMFAPFPWDVTNFRQSITIPEVVVWWLLIPLLVYGLWYALRQNFKRSVSVLLFLLVLTFTYSLSQGNVGTAYRQRSQIQVFYFIFISVGVGIWLEKRENKQLIARHRIRQFHGRTA